MLNIDHYLCNICSIWRHVDLGVMGPCGLKEVSQVTTITTQQMTGVLEHTCAKYDIYETHYLITIHERYTWTDRNRTYPKL